MPPDSEKIQRWSHDGDIPSLARSAPQGNIKIAVISDTHGHHRQLTELSTLEGIDVLVHCGNMQGSEQIANDIGTIPLNERDNLAE